MEIQKTSVDKYRFLKHCLTSVCIGCNLAYTIRKRVREPNEVHRNYHPSLRVKPRNHTHTCRPSLCTVDGLGYCLTGLLERWQCEFLPVCLLAYTKWGIQLVEVKSGPGYLRHIHPLTLSKTEKNIIILTHFLFQGNLWCRPFQQDYRLWVLADETKTNMTPACMEVIHSEK